MWPRTFGFFFTHILSHQVFVERLANWLSHTSALSAKYLFCKMNIHEGSPPLACLCGHIICGQNMQTQEKGGWFLCSRCLITFCKCTYTELWRIYSGGERIHTLPRLQSYARHLLMEWVFLFQCLHHHLNRRREMAQERKGRRLIAPVRPPSISSSNRLILGGIVLTCLCLRAVVPVVDAIFARSLVVMEGGEELDGSGSERAEKEGRDGVTGGEVCGVDLTKGRGCAVYLPHPLSSFM